MLRRASTSTGRAGPARRPRACRRRSPARAGRSPEETRTSSVSPSTARTTVALQRPRRGVHSSRHARTAGQHPARKRTSRRTRSSRGWRQRTVEKSVTAHARGVPEKNAGEPRCRKGTDRRTGRARGSPGSWQTPPSATPMLNGELASEDQAGAPASAMRLTTRAPSSRLRLPSVARISTEVRLAEPRVRDQLVRARQPRRRGRARPARRPRSAGLSTGRPVAVTELDDQRDLVVQRRGRGRRATHPARRAVPTPGKTAGAAVTAPTWSASWPV